MTPRTITGGAESAERKQELGRVESGGGDLQSQAAMWSTPNVPNGGRTLSPETVAARGMTDKGKWQVGLHNEAALWTTPQAHDEHGGNADRIRRDGTKHGCANLADDVCGWAL